MKPKIFLVVLNILLYVVLAQLTGWIIALVLVGLVVTAPILYWLKPIESFLGKFDGPPTPRTSVTAAPTDLKDHGWYLSTLESILVCLAGIGLVVGAITVLLRVVIDSWELRVSINNTVYVMRWFWLLSVPTILYIVASFEAVREDENAVKVAFGLMIEDVGPGLTFVPKWACKLVRVTSRVITLAGGTPEKVKAAERGEVLGVASGDDKSRQSLLVQSDDELLKVAGGTIRVAEEAVRITFAERQTALYFNDEDKQRFEKSTNPLGLQITTDPKVVMSLLVPKEGIRMLRRRFGTPFGALREIDDLMTGHLQILCSRVTNEYFIYRMDDFALMLQLIVERLLGDEHEITGGIARPQECLTRLGLRIDAIQSLGKTGIDIKSLRLESGLPKGVNLGLKGAVESRIAIETATNEGAAERVRLQEAGAGKASAEKASLMAKADGRKAELLAEAAGREAIIKASDSEYGRMLAKLEAMKDALANNSKVVIAPGGADLLGLLAGAKGTLDLLTTNPPTATPTPTPPPSAPPKTGKPPTT